MQTNRKDIWIYRYTQIGQMDRYIDIDKQNRGRQI